MAIDFNKPATTDNYSSAFVPALVAHQTALAQWLDSSQTTITGTPPTYAKRYNRATTAVEEFNGSAWAPIGLHGLTYSAGNLGVGYGTPVHALDLGPASGTGRARIRGVMIGNAGSGYPTVGYNASPSGPATWAYDVADTASWVYFHPTSTRFFIAAAGAAGAAITPIEYLRADLTGNLGVGTGAPTNNGATYRNIDLRGASGGGAFMYAGDGVGAKSRFGYNGAAVGTVLSSLNTDPILFEINAVTGMTLTTTGLGIGMTPVRKLDVAGNVGATLFIGPLSGNATTAAALATARTINGVAFDGSINITVADGTKWPTSGGAVAGRAYTAAVAAAYSATPTFDAAPTNLIAFGTLTANVTSMAISNPQEGQFLSIRMRQDATGGRTVALPAGAAVSGTINTAANKTSYLNLTYNATDARWDGNWSQIP